MLGAALHSGRGTLTGALGKLQGPQSRVCVRASLFSSGRSTSVWLKKIRNPLVSIMKSWMAACRVPCRQDRCAPAELTTLSAGA